MSECQVVKEVIFYTRGPGEPNILAVLADGSRYKFYIGRIKSDLVSFNLTSSTLREIGRIAYRKARPFVPEDDVWLIADSTGWFNPSEQKCKPLSDPEPVSPQRQNDLDIVQNLLYELQSTIADLP